MKRSLVYIFLNAFADYKKDRSEVETENVIMTTVAVKTYEEACLVAKEYVDKGAALVELCSGFGHVGVAQVAQAVENKTPVGVVRFDNHPGFNGESGDVRFL